MFICQDHARYLRKAKRQLLPIDGEDITKEREDNKVDNCFFSNMLSSKSLQGSNMILGKHFGYFLVTIAVIMLASVWNFFNMEPINFFPIGN